MRNSQNLSVSGIAISLISGCNVFPAAHGSHGMTNPTQPHITS